MELREIYEAQVADPNYAPTGSMLLDLVIGGGQGLGMPFGRFFNIVGDKSSGKTFLSWEIVFACLQKFGDSFRYNYDDAEQGSTIDTAHVYGTDLYTHEKNMGLYSETVEKFDGNTSLFLNTLSGRKQRGLYVLDSLDGLSDSTKEDLRKKFEVHAQKDSALNTGSYNVNLAAHLSKQYFKTQTKPLMDKNSIVIIVSQVRENLNAGMFQEKTYRAGGKAIDFHVHSCLWMYKVADIKKKSTIDGEEYPIGVIVNIRAKKNKTPRPFRNCTLILYFDYGFDDVGSCINYLYGVWGKRGELLKGSKEIEYENKVYSYDDLIKYIENTKKAKHELRFKVFEKWNNIEEELRLERRRKG